MRSAKEAWDRLEKAYAAEEPFEGRDLWRVLKGAFNPLIWAARCPSFPVPKVDVRPVRDAAL